MERHQPCKLTLAGSIPVASTTLLGSSSSGKTPPSHGGNTGSNPVGSTSLIA